jgi:hypothetical protein
MSPELAEALKQSEARPKTTFEINQAIAKPPQAIEETREPETEKKENSVLRDENDPHIFVNLDLYSRALSFIGISSDEREKTIRDFREMWNNPSCNTDLRRMMAKGTMAAINSLQFSEKNNIRRSTT